MSSLLVARAQYEAALRMIGGKVQVSTHGGAFDRKELERYAKTAPHVVLTLLGFECDLQAGAAIAEARWGVMCFTLHAPGEPRADSAIALAEAAVQVLLPLFAGEELGGRPTDMSARNVYSTPLDALGVAMWSIEWNQTLELVTPVYPDDLTSVTATWDLQPRTEEPPPEIFEVPEAQDTIELEQV